MMGQQINPDFYQGEKLDLGWTLSFGEGGWFVEECLGAGCNRTKWGPLPSKNLAMALIKERKDWAIQTFEQFWESLMKKSQ